MIILGIIVVVFLIAAVYLGRPAYHLGKAPIPKQKPVPETTSNSNESNATRYSFWGWGVSLIVVLILFLLAPWASKEHMKNVSSVEVGKKIAEISSQLSQCGDFLPEEKRAEIEGDLRKLQEMSGNKDLSSEKVMLFANSLIVKHQGDLQKAIGLEKIRQNAEKQEAEKTAIAKEAAEVAAKRAEVERKKQASILVLTPTGEGGREQQFFNLPPNTRYGDSFHFLEAVSVPGFGGANIFVGSKSVGTFDAVIPAGFKFRIPPEAVLRDGTFKLSISNVNARRINEIKIKKGGA